MHGIVNQANVPTNRDALSSRLQVGFGRDCILVVTEIVTDISQEFYQGNSEIRDVSLVPVGHDKCQPIQEELPKTSIISGEVGCLRLGQGSRWAGIVG